MSDQGPPNHDADLQHTKYGDDGVDLETGEPSKTFRVPQQLPNFRSPMNTKYTMREHVFIIGIGMMLAFNSGMSNGVCLSGLLAPFYNVIGSQSTSGLTGPYTNGALALARATMGESELVQGATNVQFFGFQMILILCYAAGSCIAGALNPRTAPWRFSPMLAPTLFIGAVFMCIAAIEASVLNIGSSIKDDNFFFFVAVANGVQNGVSSLYSANLIRTTHMTGLTTDIGLFVGQLLRGNRVNFWKLQIMLGLTFSFWFGSFVALYAVSRFGSKTLLYNAGIFLFVIILMIVFLIRNLHVPFFVAIRGVWHWQRVLHRLNLRSSDTGVPHPDEKLLHAFQVMDTDDDGFLTRDELYEGLRRAGMEQSKPNVDAMFRVCDMDSDDKINHNDWLFLIRGDNVIVG